MVSRWSVQSEYNDNAEVDAKLTLLLWQPTANSITTGQGRRHGKPKVGASQRSATTSVSGIMEIVGGRLSSSGSDGEGQQAQFQRAPNG